MQRRLSINFTVDAANVLVALKWWRNIIQKVLANLFSLNWSMKKE